MGPSSLRRPPPNCSLLMALVYLFRPGEEEEDEQNQEEEEEDTHTRSIPTSDPLSPNSPFLSPRQCAPPRLHHLPPLAFLLSLCIIITPFIMKSQALCKNTIMY
ncbi:hypothetical protein E2C01_098906 [Portunus trituberculatus]|uniref:Uncharacterized protein n=1 Tax=Portunus trituberculatus TaxID=210409 RepID=A0A5B7K9L1_PORTR|nr:hypothetical protein [Portunus trituberculatus]